MRREVQQEPDLGAVAGEWQELATEEEQCRAKIRSIDEVPLMRDCGGGAIAYLEEPVLVEGAVTALTGGPGCGKSTLACAILRRVHATGRPCLILDRENPKSIVEDRFRRLNMSDDETFRVWGGWVPDGAPQPASTLVQQWVIECRLKPVVLIDSMSAFHGGDENNASETRSFLHQCRKLADLGATPTILHHDGKAETAKDYRGSSDFPAAVDIAFHVANFGENGKLGKLVLRCFKSRFGFAGEVVYDYAAGELARRDEPQAARQTIAEQLTAVLRTNPGVSARGFDQLVAERGIARSSARAWLSDGVSSGLIRKETLAGNRQRFYLAEESSVPVCHL